jgi:2-amino-4-hydroxy-6-hydroxymethyldihydropteridine diphosphokinase
VKTIERQLGRDPAGVRFGPRVIDCDLLLWEGGTWEEPELQIPHPRLVERRFALVPLLEIDPDLTLPGGARIADIEAVLDADEQSVRRVERPDWPPPARQAYNRGPLAPDQDAT